MTFTLSPELKEQVKELTELVEKLSALEATVKDVRFLTMNDVIKLIGWSRSTVEKMFNRPDFPSCDYGKEKVVELTAFRKYFSEPRRKERA